MRQLDERLNLTGRTCDKSDPSGFDPANDCSQRNRETTRDPTSLKRATETHKGVIDGNNKKWTNRSSKRLWGAAAYSSTPADMKIG